MRGGSLFVWVSILGLGAGCAAPDADLHLAPFFSRHTVPGYDHAEAAGGVLRHGEREGTTTWALSPLYWRQTLPDGEIEADFIWPLGRYEHDPDRPRTLARLFPVFWREAEVRPDGIEDIDWSLLFPFFWGGSSSDGLENYFAFFPIIGTLKDFLTYDEVHFVLFPMMTINKKDERTATSLLWPVFGWVQGSEQGWRVFPFYGRTEVPGEYKRSYILWPFFHRTLDDLDKPEPRQGWLVVPLAGRIKQADYTATTVLWPIFGWARRPSTDYTSWQVWPILKFERGGSDGSRELSRVLPFWLHFENESTEYSSFLWPIFWVREDHFGEIERKSFYAVPLFWKSRTRRADGTKEGRWQVWPLARSEWDNQGNAEFASLAPGFQRVLLGDALSRNFGFAFEIWAGRDDGFDGPRHRRVILDLFHSAESAGHKRWSIPFLGGQWTEPNGVVHTSLLLGLLRFRSGPGGGLEEPAFPGPGWPDLHKVRIPSRFENSE